MESSMKRTVLMAAAIILVVMPLTVQTVNSLSITGPNANFIRFLLDLIPVFTVIVALFFSPVIGPL